mgnify:CR=1 FL=1
MTEIRYMTFQESLDLDEDEFAKAVIIQYKECQPGKTITREELDAVIEWADSAREEGYNLNKLLTGEGSVRIHDGWILCSQTRKAVGQGSRDEAETGGRVLDS